MTKLQKTMLMFLNKPNTWYTMKTAKFMINGEFHNPNNIFDDVKYLERLTLPTGRKLRFLRERVLNHETGKISHCKVKLQEDLTSNELRFIKDLRNIKQVRMCKSNSLFDKIKSLF